MKNKVQLITYVDRLGGGNIAELHQLLKGPLAGLFSGVPLLPFYYPINGAVPVSIPSITPRSISYSISNSPYELLG